MNHQEYNTIRDVLHALNEAPKTPNGAEEVLDFFSFLGVDAHLLCLRGEVNDEPLKWARVISGPYCFKFDGIKGRWGVEESTYAWMQNVKRVDELIRKVVMHALEHPEDIQKVGINHVRVLIGHYTFALRLMAAAQSHIEFGDQIISVPDEEAFKRNLEAIIQAHAGREAKKALDLLRKQAHATPAAAPAAPEAK